MTSKKQNLGRALSILIAHEQMCNDMHDDVDAFHAPSECRDTVRKWNARDFRRAKKHACSVAGVRNLRELRAACKRSVPSWDRYNYFRLGLSCV